jgi:hypothetical protein
LDPVSGINTIVQYAVDNGVQLDSRGVCASGDNTLVYNPDVFACLSTSSGGVQHYNAGCVISSPRDFERSRNSNVIKQKRR